MGKPLRVLMVGESPDGALLIADELRRGGYEPRCERVETAEELLRALENGPWDLLISDYDATRLRTTDALRLLREHGLDAPFVVVSGTAGEEVAVETMRAGADDYVMKDRLARLGYAVDRGLREARARRHSEAGDALRAGGRRFRDLVEQAADAIFVLDPEGGIVDANRHACESLGYSHEELLAMSMREIDAGESAGPPAWDEVKSGAPVTVEAVYRRKDGTTFPAEVRIGVFEEEERLVIAGVRDLTERREAERRLREAETRYGSLVEQIPAVTYVQEPIESDNPKAVTYMSPQYETMLGYPPEAEILDEEHWLRTLHPDDRDRVLAEEDRTDATGEPFEVEYRVIAGDGRVVWVRDHAVLVRDEDGRPLFWQGVQFDITDQKLAEEALRDSEERFRATFEQAAVGMAHVALDGRWLHFNKKLLEIVGYDREELLGLTFQDITHPDDLDADLDHVRRLLAGEIETYSMDKRYFRKDGSVVWIELTGSLVRKPSGDPDYFIAVIEDITARKRSEQERARLASIVESSEDAIISKSLDGTITSWNRGAQRLYGYSAGEAVGRPITIIVPPELPDEIPEILRRLGRGEKMEHYETVRVTREGRNIDVSLTVSPIKDSAGSVVGASAIARDITERKRVEQRVREAREAERTRIAQDIHDDALQSLIFALQEVQVLQISGEDGREAPGEALEDVADALRRSVEGLRSAIFELRLEHTLGRAFDTSLRALVELARRMSRNRFAVSLEVEDGFPKELSRRTSGELIRILQEALNNARRHSSPRNVSVRLWREGDMAFAEVADDGLGFDAGSSDGGVGLSTMRRRASSLGGGLVIESAPGAGKRGTRVRFEAPIGGLLNR